MARIQFELPAQFIFATDIPIYISHVNQGGHLDNALLLTLVSEARVRFFRSLGYASELDIEGHTLVVGDMLAQYKSEAFYGETMHVQMVPADLNKYGFDLVFQLTDLASGREVARGKTGVVFLNNAAEAGHKKVSPAPAPLLDKLRALGAPL
jgi:acyl-CoA thioester hydrolase